MPEKKARKHTGEKLRQQGTTKLRYINEACRTPPRSRTAKNEKGTENPLQYATLSPRLALHFLPEKGSRHQETCVHWSIIGFNRSISFSFSLFFYLFLSCFSLFFEAQRKCHHTSCACHNNKKRLQWSENTDKQIFVEKRRSEKAEVTRLIPTTI